MNSSVFFVAPIGLALLFASGCESKPAPEASPAPDRAAAPDRAGAAKEAAPSEKGYSWVKVGEGGDALQSKIKAEAGKATGKNQKPVVYIGATWCEPCQAIKKHKGDARMVEALQGAYIIELDLDDWKVDDLKALGFRAGIVPVFHVVGADGRASGPTIDGGAWGDNIPENMAPPLKKFFSG